MTPGPRRRTRLSRRAKIALSVGASVVGTALVVVAAAWVEAARDTDLGDERVGVSQRFSHAIPDDAPQVRMTDVTAELGIAVRHGHGERTRRLPEDTGSGLAWGDFDGDGDPDLYVVDLRRAGPNAPGGNHLLRNDAGRFTDVTDAAGVADSDGMGMGATFVDFDDDGDLDLHVTNDGPDRLFENRGDGTFVDVAERVGLTAPGWSVGAAWGDFDADGDLDVYVCSYVQYEELPATASAVEMSGGYLAPAALNPKVFDPAPNHLFANRGDGTFEDVATALGVDDPRGRSLAATFCDFDGDGRLDLWVNNDVSPNALFLGRAGEDGSARFEDASLRTGTADPRGSMGLSVADVTGATGGPDGVPDTFVTHWVAQENALYEGVLSPGGALFFRDRAQPLLLGEASLAAVGWGCAFVDFDLDGRRDVIVANGSTLEDDAQPPRMLPQRPFLFWNGGVGTGAGGGQGSGKGLRFHDLTARAGEAFATPRVARGLAVADYDGDGDCDVAILVNRGPVLLFRNDTAGVGRSLSVRLARSEAASRGARVQVTCDARTWTWWYAADVSYASQHDPAAPIGLGSARGPATVEVRWTDGTTTRVEGVAGPTVVVR